VIASWAREPDVRTPEDFAQLMAEQFPFHFADPLDPRIDDYLERTSQTVYAPDMLRVFSANGYGGIEVEDRLGEITQPVLVMTGRHDRTCTVAAAEAIAAGISNAELRILEQSGHMTFVEEPELYIALVRSFLERTT
jgi:pimeloyl-ACP methyl ester carboxylesterase